jgi:AraC-like DNA-binding protein
MLLARNTFLITITDVAEFHRVKRADLLAELGLDASAIETAGSFVEASKLVDAVAYVARASGRRDFGMLLGGHNDHRTWGPIGLLLEHSSSVSDAIALSLRFVQAHNAALTYALNPAARDTYTFELKLAARGKYPSHQYIETQLTLWLRFARLMLGETWSPLAVHVRHARQADARAYRRTFGCPVRFGEAFDGLLVARADFDRNVKHDPRVREVTRLMLADLNRALDENIAVKVASVLRPLLGSGRAGAAAVAKALSLAPRTLQRRLAERGTTFQDVVRDTRLQMAHELLPRPGMTLARLAPLLGLSEASAVSRLLRQSGGPNRTRRKHASHKPAGARAFPPEA